LSTNDLDGDLKKLAVEFGIWLRWLRRFENFQIHNRCIISAFINQCDILSSMFTLPKENFYELRNFLRPQPPQPNFFDWNYFLSQVNAKFG